MSKQKEVKSDQDVAKDVVATHGNKLLCEVARFFRQNEWGVRISQFYVDPTTDKAREIDLIVEKDFNQVDGRGQKLPPVNIRLFIECKYILIPTVFWFEELDECSRLYL